MGGKGREQIAYLLDDMVVAVIEAFAKRDSAWEVDGMRERMSGRGLKVEHANIQRIIKCHIFLNRKRPIPVGRSGDTTSYSTAQP